jgi:hypothetical protein
MLGYKDDERLLRSIQLLQESIRFDGGYLCDMHELTPSQNRRKSCIRGSLKVLAAFAELGPGYWKHPSCERLVEYFLDRGGIYTRNEPRALVNEDVHTMIFPFHWRAGLVEVLYYLSRMGHGNDPRLESAWNLLNTKVDKEGRYVLEWTPRRSPWKVGTRGSANRWMTFYALLALRFAGRQWEA